MALHHSEAHKTENAISNALMRIEDFLGDDDGIKMYADISVEDAKKTMAMIKQHLGTAKNFIEDQAGGLDNFSKTVDEHWIKTARELAVLVDTMVNKYIEHHNATDGPPQLEIHDSSWIARVESCLGELVESREKSVPLSQFVEVGPVIEPGWVVSGQIWQICLLVWKGLTVWWSVTRMEWNLVFLVWKLLCCSKKIPGAMAGLVVEQLTHLRRNPLKVASHVGTFLWRVAGIVVVGVQNLQNALSRLSLDDSEIDHEIDLVNFLTNEYMTYPLSEVLPRKVLAIVGPVGTGKDALADRLLKHTQSNFHCSVSVEFTYQDLASVKEDLLKNLCKIDKHNSAGNQGEGDLRCIQKFLTDKRYLIVMKNVWGTNVRNIVEVLEDVLPDNRQSSRVIITTCRNDVAEMSCKGKFDLIYRLPRLMQRQDLHQDKPSESISSFPGWSATQRTCLLYLIPNGEHHLEFDRESMARKWVGDGFISEIKRAREHFDKLINWNVIQPVEDGHSFGEEPTYLVHPTVLPILKKHLQKNKKFEFLTDETNGPDPPQQNCKPCRLYVKQSSSQGQQLMDINLSEVRSVTIRGSVKREVIQKLLGEAKLLRVLDLEGCNDVENHLDVICQMKTLKYLSLKGTKITDNELINNISKLEKLEALDLRVTPLLRKKPKELELLKHLLYCPGVCIETVDVRPPPWVKVLQAVHINTRRVPEVIMFQQQDGFSDNDSQTSSWEPTIEIEKIMVAGRCVSIPDCIKQWKLDSVASLDIRVVKLEVGDLETLGRMKSLKTLVLALAGLLGKEIPITAKTGFGKLEVLALDFHKYGLDFQEGAMPRLRSLYLKLHAGKQERTILLSGTRHLASLSEVTLKCSEVYKGSDCLKKATAEVVEEARRRTKPITVYIENYEGSECHKEATTVVVEEALRGTKPITTTPSPSIPRIQVPNDIRDLHRLWLLRKLKTLFFQYVSPEQVPRIRTALAVAHGCAVALPGHLTTLWRERYTQQLLFPGDVTVVKFGCVYAILYLVYIFIVNKVITYIWLTSWLLKLLANGPVGKTIFAFFLLFLFISFIIPK